MNFWDSGVPTENSMKFAQEHLRTVLPTVHGSWTNSLLDTLSALVKPPKTCSTNETTKIRQRKQKKRITARVIQLWLFNEFWVKNKSITHLAKGHANESLNFIISYYQHMLSPKIHVKVVHWLR